MDDSQWQIDGPYPPRSAAAWLRHQLAQRLETLALSVGAPVPSEREWMRRTGISRSAVRRAVSALVAEGWLERRAGQGLFVGRRRLAPGSLLAEPLGDAVGARIAVIANRLGETTNDWYTRGIVTGMDRVARQCGLLLDPIGRNDRDPAVLLRIIEQHRPDILVLLGSNREHTLLAAAGRRLGIPTLATGAAMAELNPVVAKDSTHGMRLGTDLLVQAGHQRIACVLPSGTSWAFERREGWLDALRMHDLPCDARDLIWVLHQPLAPGPVPRPDAVTDMVAVLRARRPTALILGSNVVLETTAAALAEIGWRVPHDCSLVAYGQDLDDHQRVFPDVSLTSIDQPLERMGEELAHLAQKLLHHHPVPRITWVPCTLNLRDSIKPPRHDAEPHR